MLQLQIPVTLRDWIDAQVQSGRYVDAGDYLRDLIRRDQQSDDDVFDALEEGAASGTANRSLDDVWAAVRAKTGHG